jgi:hypothetical protein
MDHNEFEILKMLNQVKGLPIVRFELRNSQEKSLISTALNNAWITSIDDSMEKVKLLGGIFQSLQDKKLIEIHYNTLLSSNFNYDIYEKSNLYRFFLDTVEEGKQRSDFLFDCGVLNKGFARITPKGEKELTKR